MSAKLAEWNARYLEATQKPLAEPASIVSEWLPLLPTGNALDVACGTGRHTLLLATHCESVTAIDWSGAALDILEDRSRKAKFPVRRVDVATMTESTKHSARGIQIVLADLEDLCLPAESFSLILCLEYLQRPLFAQISSALRPGGVLLMETFTRGQLDFSGGPRNPAYLLDPGELRTAFPELHVLFYRELNAGQGIASLVAQKPNANC